MKTLVIIRGMPGTGKTTLLKSYKEQGFKTYEMDYWRAKTGTESWYFDLDKTRERLRQVSLKLNETFLTGEDVALAGIFARDGTYTQLARKAESNGYSVKVVSLTTFYSTTRKMTKDDIENVRSLSSKQTKLKRPKPCKKMHLLKGALVDPNDKYWWMKTQGYKDHITNQKKNSCSP